MFTVPLLTTVFLAAAAPATAAGGATVRPAIIVAKPKVTSIRTALAASPATITFTASNPDTTPSVSGSGPVTLTWGTTGGLASNTWQLSVSAPASFSTCSNLPASAVTATCTTITGGAGTCGGPVPLSTTGIQVASGNEQPGNRDYSVVLTFTLADSWTYLPSTTSCSLTLTYTVTVN
jgi:hypothetical protein